MLMMYDLVLSCVIHYTFHPTIPFDSYPNDKILDASKLNEFEDDNFKFDENCRKSSSLIENNVGKGEIACYKQFLLFTQCFQTETCIEDIEVQGKSFESIV